MLLSEALMAEDVEVEEGVVVFVVVVAAFVVEGSYELDEL